jgi:hypothetical protein
MTSNIKEKRVAKRDNFMQAIYIKKENGFE